MECDIYCVYFGQSWDDCSKYGDDFTMSGSTDIDYFRYYSGYDSGYESGYDHVPVDRVVRNSDGSASVHVSYNEEDVSLSLDFVLFCFVWRPSLIEFSTFLLCRNQ